MDTKNVIPLKGQEGTRIKHLVNHITTTLPKLGDYTPLDMHIEDRVFYFGRILSGMIYALSSYGTNVVIAVWNGKHFEFLLEDIISPVTRQLTKQNKPFFIVTREPNPEYQKMNELNSYYFTVKVGNDVAYLEAAGNSNLIADHFDPSDSMLSIIEKKVHTHGTAAFRDEIFKPCVKLSILSNMLLDGKLVTTGTNYNLYTRPEIKIDDGFSILDMVFSKRWTLDTKRFPIAIQREFLDEFDAIFVHTDGKPNGEIIAIENYEGAFVKSVDFYLKSPLTKSVPRYRIPVLSPLLTREEAK